MESNSLNDFQSKSYTNLSEFEFQRKNKEHQNENFLKNTILEVETMEFGKKRWTCHGVLLVDLFPIK